MLERSSPFYPPALMSSAAEANAAFFPPTGGPPVDSYTSWRDQLLTPSPTPSLGNSPVTGPAAPEDRTPQSLSFPVPIPALQAQLEAWASLSLDPASAASWASLRHGAAAAEASSGWSETWESPHNSFSGEAFPEPGPSCVSQEGGQQPPAPVGSYGSHHSAHAFLSAPPAHHHHPYLQQQQAPPGALFAATSVEGLDLVVDDEVLTVAAKEDKRKRNTTASGELSPRFSSTPWRER